MTIVVGGMSTASCKLTSPSTASIDTEVLAGKFGEQNVMIEPYWGSLWAPGTYTLSATCSLAGYPDATATQDVIITP